MSCHPAASRNPNTKVGLPYRNASGQSRRRTGNAAHEAGTFRRPALIACPVRLRIVLRRENGNLALRPHSGTTACGRIQIQEMISEQRVMVHFVKKYGTTTAARGEILPIPSSQKAREVQRRTRRRLPIVVVNYKRRAARSRAHLPCKLRVRESIRFGFEGKALFTDLEVLSEGLLQHH